MDFEQVNRVLIQLHWRKDCDQPPPLMAVRHHRAGRASRSERLVSHLWCPCSKNAACNPSILRVVREQLRTGCSRGIVGQKTAIGAGRSASWRTNAIDFFICYRPNCRRKKCRFGIDCNNKAEHVYDLSAAKVQSAPCGVMNCTRNYPLRQGPFSQSANTLMHPSSHIGSLFSRLWRLDQETS